MSEFMADAFWAKGRLSEGQADDILSAIDAAFTQVVFARYGGAVGCVLARDGSFSPEQILRASPTGQGETLTMELHLRGVADAQSGPSRSAGTLITTIGVVTLGDPPLHAVEDVQVITEVFDNQDPNEHAEAASLQGVRLHEADSSAAGHVPGLGLSVMRSSSALTAAGQDSSLRGWLPRAQRTQTSRTLGLSSNGHSRATITALRVPITMALLSGLGAAVAGAGPVGEAAKRLVFAIDGGPTG